MKRYIRSNHIGTYMFVDFIDLKKQYDTYMRKIMPNSTYIDADGNTKTMIIQGVHDTNSNHGRCAFYLECPNFVYNMDGKSIDLYIAFIETGDPKYDAVIRWNARGTINVGDTGDDFQVFSGKTDFSNYRNPEITLENLFNYITKSVLKENISFILNKAYDYRDAYNQTKLPKRKKGDPRYLTYLHGDEWPEEFQKAVESAMRKLKAYGTTTPYLTQLWKNRGRQKEIETIYGDDFPEQVRFFWEESRDISEFKTKIFHYVDGCFG